MEQTVSIIWTLAAGLVGVSFGLYLMTIDTTVGTTGLLLAGSLTCLAIALIRQVGRGRRRPRGHRWHIAAAGDSKSYPGQAA